MLRLFLGFILLPNGFRLASDYLNSISWLTRTDFNLPLGLAYLIIVTQLYACLFLSVGLAGRYLAIFILFYTLLALPLHIHKEVEMDWLGQIIGEGIKFHLVVSLTCMVLIYKGSGRFSIDAVIKKALKKL